MFLVFIFIIYKKENRKEKEEGRREGEKEKFVHCSRSV
jgi:cbb3-type cytochrome oxidase subunit 3